MYPQSKNKIFTACMCVVLSFYMISCASKKLATKGKKPIAGEVAIAIPCAEFNSDKGFFRATQSASSRDMAMARDKALLNAKTRLASLIQTRLKNVFLIYRNERSAGDAKEYNDKYEQEARDVANQVLKDVKIVCEKVTKSPDGNFNSYVAVEMSKENILEQAKNGISKDSRLKIDYDEKKFREVFEKEMAELKEAN